MTPHEKEPQPPTLEALKAFDKCFEKMLTKHLRGHSDATAYIQVSEWEKEANDGGGELSLGDYLRIRYSRHEPKNDPWQHDFSLNGWRVQASRCFQGRAWSFTVRRGTVHAEHSDQDLRTWIDSLKSDPFKKYKPSDCHVYEDRVSIASYEEISGQLLKMLDPHDRPQKLTGLIFLTGETNCGKSNLARGMIWRYLRDQRCGTKDRNLHVITYEDPIEEWVFDLDSFSNPQFAAKERRLDYTPRQKDIDCRSLEDAVEAAKRQSPTLFYAGELRQARDLKTALEFGGTGHLIFATGHAGSLVEAATKVLTAVEAFNPTHRALYVPKILAIVHLKRFFTKFKELEVSMIVPSLYKDCPQGRHALVSDGLASVLPYCPATDAEEKKFGSLGRQHMARKIMSGNSGKIVCHENTTKEWKDEYLPCEREWQEFREYHAGTDRTTEEGHPSMMGPPLWVQSAEDDVDVLT